MRGSLRGGTKRSRSFRLPKLIAYKREPLQVFREARRLLILTVRSLSSADLTSQNDSDQNFGFSRSKPLMHQGIRFPVLSFSSRPSRLRSTTALVYVAACVLACAAGGCGSTVATSTGPSPAKCAVTLTAPDAVTGGGATTTVAVATQPECAWSASSEVVWITGLTPASGQGSSQL